MPSYNSKFQRTASGTLTVGTLSNPGAGPRRLKIFEIILGSEGSLVSESVFSWILRRTTAAGTSTAVTPQLLNPADSAAVAVAGENHTVEPTYTANANCLPPIPLNQRATFRW